MKLQGLGVMFKADKERELRFTTNALCKMEEKLGYSVMQLQDNVGFSTLRTIFQCGLLWQGELLSEEEVGDIIDEALKHYSYEKLMEDVVAKALDKAIPSENNKEHPAKKSFGGKRN